MPQGSETVLWVAIFTLKIKQLLTVVINLLLQELTTKTGGPWPCGSLPYFTTCAKHDKRTL